MKCMVFLVLQNSTLLEEIIAAWENLGVSGITILPSLGMTHARKGKGFREDMPLFPGLEDLLLHTEESNRTIFTVVADQETAERVASATVSVTGDLNLPNTGILTILPVIECYGLDRGKTEV